MNENAEKWETVTYDEDGYPIITGGGLTWAELCRQHRAKMDVIALYDADGEEIDMDTDELPDDTSVKYYIHGPETQIELA